MKIGDFGWILIFCAVFVLFYTDTFTFKINNPNTKNSIISISRSGIDTGVQNTKEALDNLISKLDTKNENGK